jgi:hypothetical protein
MQASLVVVGGALGLGRCRQLARRRPGSCAGKGLLTEAGLKSPIFDSEDSAIDGAVMLEKLSAMQM